MTATRFVGALACGVAGEKLQRKRPVRGVLEGKTSTLYLPGPCYGVNSRKGLRFKNVIRNCGLIAGENVLDYDLGPPNLEEEILASTTRSFIDGSSQESISLAGTSTSKQGIQTELIMLSLPAIAGQAIEPLTQLMETAYIGKVGPLALASAGVSLSIFNILSKVFNIPLLSVATSFVAEDISNSASNSTTSDERIPLPSVSTALVLAVGIGVLEGLAMYIGSGWFLSVMGVPEASPMRVPAQRFLKLRAFGAPAVVVSLAIQGIFRGFKDTKTPMICLGIGNAAAVLFFPMFMYYFRMGVTGAAVSTIASQYIVTFMMIWYLNKRTTLLLPNIKNLQFGGYLKSGGFLLGRTLAAVMTITLSTSMAARQGPLAMAAHQICLQVWLSISLLADAQAASGQALIASSFAKRDYSTVKEIAYFALKTGLVTGTVLAIVLGVSFSSLATLFTNDMEVLAIIRSILPIVCASLPVNALAYIFDGLHYGISDFPFAACSMMVVGAMSSAFLLYAPTTGLSGVWIGLTLFMGLRTVAGYMRLSSKDGPWWFLQEPVQKPQVG